ncbi:MAG TPA: AAA family ATPase [Tepidisphaeraceae bacterium]|nr:AAA family ATPase [Tepidisphaeraceae bacterium]
MSREIQVRSSQPHLPTTPDEVFGAAGGGMMMGPAQPSPAAKLHRMMRGRYALAITLALIGATIGAVAGWFSQRAEVMSTAMVSIDPVIRGITNSDKVMQQYETFLRSQPYNILSDRVITAAMNTDEWKQVGWSADTAGMMKFRAAMDTSTIRGTQNIMISFTHPDPQVAQTGAKSIVKAYSKLYSDMNGSQLREDLLHLDSRITNDTAAMRNMQQQIIDLSAPYGSSDLSVPHNGMQQKQLEAEQKLIDANISLENANLAMAAKKDWAVEAAKLTPEQIAETDPTMQSYLTQLQNLKFEQMRNRQLGPEHPTSKRLMNDIESTERFIAGLTETYRKNWIGPPIQVGPNNAPMQLTESNLKWLQGTVAVLEQQYKEYVNKTTALGRVRTEIERLTNEISNHRADIEKMERTRDEKLIQAAQTGVLKIVEEGGPPVPATDKRKQMAFVGFVGGGALPIALMLLIGMLDSRYRYSEEASMDMSGVTLLGILPNLPDRLTDPDQAATAAHCVHQIRTMLQINSGGDDQQVYCVTSASPGDGKTSLTLALALSFAASGSRTLLIDCDLVGAGLTARLDMGGPEGVLEAMTNRSLLEYIRQTDIADLAMLPVGSAQAHHAGLFSPAALRRLVTEAKKHFEVVLIDTGPILGSIEATPVCAASDAVILTVSRGQQRPIVEKALQHLLSIGARFAGVVFNRAQTRDFERSISGMSLRSVARHQQHGANGNGNGGGRFRKPQEKTFGPVARAVASSFNPPGDGSRDDV